MPEQASCVSGADVYARLTGSGSGDVDGIVIGSRGPHLLYIPGYETDANGLPYPPAVKLATLGNPCGHATDPTGCQQKIAQLLSDPSSRGWGIPLDRNLANDEVEVGVLTSRDDVRLANRDDVIAWSAPIDTRDEAYAVLYLVDGTNFIDCGQNNARRDPGGWTFRVTTRNGCGGVSEGFTTVTPGGQLVPSGSKILHASEDGCED
jgi:hypothetical protein